MIKIIKKWHNINPLHYFLFQFGIPQDHLNYIAVLHKIAWEELQKLPKGMLETILYQSGNQIKRQLVRSGKEIINC